MVMSGFSQLDLEKRLTQLKDTADSIQTLSAWCLKHKHQHRRIVNSWFKILKRAKVQQRLPLFYLANDVIQYSKRKNLEFVPSFQTVLEGAMPLVRDEKLRPAITRILKIWEDRGVFDSTFTSTLSSVVSNVAKADTKENAEILSDFRTSDLIKTVREVDSSGKETDKLLKTINDGEFHVSDTALDDLRTNIKSRSQSKLFVSELEDGVRAVERYVSALDREIQQRAELIEQLERSEIYYETQRADAKVVAVAYKNFSKRVREVKRKLEELVPELPDVSPVPSPDINAPSPTNSDDGLQLPDDAAAAAADGGGGGGGGGDGPDPRSEIERLLGSWTGGGSAGSQSDSAAASAEDGAQLAEFPPPPQLSEPEPEPVSAIAVVTGVKQGGTVSSQNTPLEDDHDYEEEEEYESAGGDGGGTPGHQSLSDLMRLIGRQLQPAAAAPATQIPGLDLSRPPPVLPDVTHPPPAPAAGGSSGGGGGGRWPAQPPPAPPPPPPPSSAGRREHSWEETDADAPCSPPPFEKGNSAYNSQIDLPPAFKAVDEGRLPFLSSDMDHRVLPTVPPPVPTMVPPPADLDLRQAPPPPPPPPTAAAAAAAAPASDTDHRSWDRSVDDFISQVTEDRDYRRRADADYRPPPTDLADADDNDSLDMEISDGERDGGHSGRRASAGGGGGTPGRAAARRHSSDTPGRPEQPRSAEPSAAAAAAAAADDDDDDVDGDRVRERPEVVELDDDDLPEVTAGVAGSLEAVDDPSVSSWSTSEASPEPASETRRSRHRSGEKRNRKRHRRDSGSRKHKKERRMSHSRRRDRRTSGEQQQRRRRSTSGERDEPRRKSKSKKRSRDRSRSREKGRGWEQDREKGRSRDRHRHHSWDKGRSRDRDRDRSRSRSRDKERRHGGGGGGGGGGSSSSSFDYSQVGAGASHRDRGSRRW